MDVAAGWVIVGSIVACRTLTTGLYPSGSKRDLPVGECTLSWIASGCETRDYLRRRATDGSAYPTRMLISAKNTSIDVLATIADHP